MSNIREIQERINIRHAREAEVAAQRAEQLEKSVETLMAKQAKLQEARDAAVQLTMSMDAILGVTSSVLNAEKATQDDVNWVTKDVIWMEQRFGAVTTALVAATKAVDAEVMNHINACPCCAEASASVSAAAAMAVAGDEDEAGDDVRVVNILIAAA